MSATVNIGIKSVDGKVDSVIVARTSQKICGRMKPTNWMKYKIDEITCEKSHFPNLLRVTP